MGAILSKIVNSILCKRYEKLTGTARINKWYEVDTPGAVSADGSMWHGFMKVGSENKVIINFFGGGCSVDDYSAARGYSIVQEDGFYCDRFSQGLYAMARCMSMFGIGKKARKNPFRNWSMISIPYSTGDFHAGCGEVEYISLTGEKKTLYHHGLLDFKCIMKEALKQIVPSKIDSVLVTGGSAGGFASAILADMAFDYFPNASQLTVAVDGGLMNNEKWHEIVKERWHAPKEISDRIKTDNITLDCLLSLHEKRGDSVKILFDCAIRDAALSKVQAYFYGTDHKPDKHDGDVFQQILKDTVYKLKRTVPEAGVYLFEMIQDTETALMQHTILFTPFAFRKLNGHKSSVQWVYDCINKKVESYGLELLEKEY